MLPRFFLATFALTWAAWAAAAALPVPAASRPSALAAFRAAVFLLGVFAPGIVAVALTAKEKGRAGVSILLREIGRWQVHVAWYAFAVTYLAAIKLLAAVVHRVATGAWPRFGETPWYVMAGALLVSTWVQAGEEVGWRGYALPRLASRIGLARASVVLGAIWAAWHLPLFFAVEGDVSGQSFPVYVLQVTAISVTMAWLYWRTGRSLLLVMLFHAAVNNTKDVVPSAVPGATAVFSLDASLIAWLTVALLWLGAAWFLASMRSMRGAKLPALPDRYR